LLKGERVAAEIGRRRWEIRYGLRGAECVYIYDPTNTDFSFKSQYHGAEVCDEMFGDVIDAALETCT